MNGPEIRELAAGETRLAFAAMRELRPRLGSQAEFVTRVDEVQRPQGYRLVGAFLDGDEQAVAVAGFRVVDYLAWGHALYCDDLSTRPEHRSRGLGDALVEWLVAEARRQRCESFHLDSGVGPDRAAAHQLYMRHHMRISSHHFSLDL